MIRMTKATDYGIVLLTCFAAGTPDSTLNARDLAEQTHLPIPMVSKILKLLTRAGLLESHRGMKGGYSLSRRPEQITVAEIVGSLEGPIAITECVGGPASKCEIERLCPMRSNWSQINEAVKSALAGITLAQMARPMHFRRNTTAEIIPISPAEALSRN